MAGIWRRRATEWRPGRRPEPSPPDPMASAIEAADFMAVLERLSEGVLLVDADRTVHWINTSARHLVSAIDQPIGRLLVEVVRDHRLDALAQRVLEAKSEESLEIELPVSARIVQVRAVPLDGGRAVLIMQDLTRLRYLETVRQQFVANLSHEIRTPLAGLDLAAQTLSGQLPDSGDSRVFIDRVIQESQRLQLIVHNLAQLAALDAEVIEVERINFKAAELIAELVDRYQARAEAAGLQLRAEIGDPGAEALGDRGKTDQALQSIVDNALKFTRAGEVVVRTQADEGRVEITVRDTGVGIPSRDLPRIFERFYKVDRARGGLPGSGLGLSIARHLIELQGGTVTAESTPGIGTVVQVRLPRAPLTSR